MRLLTITGAEYVDGYRIRAEFSTGETLMLDFEPIVGKARGVVAKLANLDYFKSFRLDPFTIDWNNEIGFDPQDLYDIGRPV